MVRIAIDVKVDPKDGRTYFTGALLARLDGTQPVHLNHETSIANKVLKQSREFVGTLSSDVRSEKKEVK